MKYETRFVILALCIRYNFKWDDIYNALSRKESIDDKFYEEVCAYGTAHPNFVTVLDEEYPKRFLGFLRPPFLFFYEGDLSVLKFVNQNPNPFIFLYGDNRFRFPSSHVVSFTSNFALDIGGQLKIWDCSGFPNSFLLVPRVCQTIVCTNRYSRSKGLKTKFNSILKPFATSCGCDIYFAPTSGPSYNNDCIKEGYSLLTSYEDISSLSNSKINLAF
jgi:hypothetical protein